MDSGKPVRLLCSADLHLGRYPSRIPTGRRELSVEYIWERLVDYAIDEGVDALVLAGDLVDQDNKFFESFAPLERGLKRLGKADIPTFAVAGNHDYDVLPRLAEVLDPDTFRLLGRGGRWEEATLTRSGVPVLGFLGWSFSDKVERESPLRNVPQPRSDIPVLGLVHGDLNADRSRYAPLAESDLRRVPVASWLLGHIHRPAVSDHRAGCILYPGSLQPLDPGEQGDHGAFLLEVHSDGAVHARQVHLATVKYAECEVDLTGVDKEDDFNGTVVKVLRAKLEQELEGSDTLRHVVYRPRYVGRTAIDRQIDALHAHARLNCKVPVGEAHATLDDHTLATRPDLDLGELAAGRGPISELARMLITFESDETLADLGDLLREVGSALGSITRASAYLPLAEHGYAGEPDEPEILRLLARQSRLLLDELIVQARGGDA